MRKKEEFHWCGPLNITVGSTWPTMKNEFDIPELDSVKQFKSQL